jgi:hypothetical protein
MGSLADLGTFVTPTSRTAAGDAFVVVPNDAADQPKPFRWLRANGAGTIRITTAAGSTVTCNFLAGETRNIAGSRVWATGTTVAVIEAMI